MIKIIYCYFLSRLPQHHPILTPLVSFISLCTLFEVVLVHSLGTLTLTDIDHVRIMKSIVFATQKIGGITGKSDPKHTSIHGNWTPPDPYIGSIGSNTKRYKETHTRHAGQSHLMRVTWTSALPEIRHHCSYLVYRCSVSSSITFNSDAMEGGF